MSDREDADTSTRSNPRKRPAEDGPDDDGSQRFDPMKLQAKRRAIDPVEPSRDPPVRKQKRPGARARISEAERAAIRERQAERDRQAALLASQQEEQQVIRGNSDVVRQHYNAVPERGREWRTTDSKIKGLRAFNNWVKSCIIQRYSPDEDHTPGSREAGRSSGRELLVLDIGCGKGGDLNKWQQAPQPIQLYVGLDPAEVSIAQAKDRYRTMSSRGGGRGGGRGGHHPNHRRPPRVFDARFYVKDCYGSSIEDLDIIQQVGFDPSPMNRRGFDIVSMMFSMHYAFESEQNARNMLRNVAGALKKGGRFIGCIPNSDVLGEHVRQFNERAAAKKETNGKNGSASPQNGAITNYHGAITPPLIVSDDEDDEQPRATADDGAPQEGASSKHDSPTSPAPKEAPGTPQGDAEDGELEEGEEEPTAEWGNSIYRVRFPGATPSDGVFRPAFGWKYNFFLDEAVEEVPEYVVPWEAFRALAEDFNLELQFHRTFQQIWDSEKDDREMGMLSERMRVRDRETGELLVSEEEMEAARFYIGFCFYKV